LADTAADYRPERRVGADRREIAGAPADLGADQVPAIIFVARSESN
jgi:hypothetical protein